MDEPDIQEAEIVTDDQGIVTPSVRPTQSSDAERLKTLMTLEERIKRQVTQIDTLTAEKKEHTQMLSDVFLNDPTYQQHDKTAKDAAKVKSRTRSEIMKRPSVIELSEKLKDMKIQLKELQMMMSNDLVEYQQMAGVNEIEDNDGQVREIVSNFKLIKKSSRK